MSENSIQPESLSPAPGSRRTRTIVAVVGGLLVIFVLMQFVRFIVPSFEISNPAVTQTINWDSPRTEQLARTACFDCHSNETDWRWYSYIAPVGWLVARDVNEGRGTLNFSIGNYRAIREAAEVIQEGEMPPATYLLTHSNAKLNDAAKTELIAGLRATFSGVQIGAEDEGGGDDD